MIAGAVIAVSVAVVFIIGFALRYGQMAHDLGKSEADRDRLEMQLRAVVADDKIDAAASMARVATLLKEQEVLRAEIRRRRRPGDALARLRLLSEAGREVAGNDRQDKP